MAIEQINVPDIGGSEGAEVIEVLVAVGDEVAVDQGLIVLESDKASMEIPCTVAGKVVELLVSEGDELVEGAPVVKIEVAGEEAESGAADESGESDDDGGADEQSGQDAGEDSDEDGESGDDQSGKESRKSDAGKEALKGEEKQTERKEDKREKKQQEKQEDKQEEKKAEKPEEKAPRTDAGADPDPLTRTGGKGIYAGPAVRKRAREFGVPLDRVDGTGPHGRILKEDLQQFVKRSLDSPVAATGAAVPEVDFSEFGEVEITTRSKLDKLTAANMHRSWVNGPQVTQFDDADITGLEAFRRDLKPEAEQRGTKLTPLPFLLKACAVALRRHPKLNASLANGGEDLVYRQFVHIGMAVDTPAGLLVPVIRDVERKSVWELAEEVAELASRARDRKLTPRDMQGGCFTVSSLGNIGGTGFTPIINTPEVAILGVSRAAVRPVWDGEAFAPRTLLPLALSYDHRVVNGGDGGRFLSDLVALLGDIRRLVL